MNKITPIHLNGKAFQLEDAAYRALRTYLQEAEARLADNPDKQEIIDDLEQAIADKCSARLGDKKDVVTAQEMTAILEEMGRVVADDAPLGADNQAGNAKADNDTEPGARAAAGSPRPKRLYNIPDGAMIAGVCNGLAAYFSVDVVLVRLAFVALTFVTGGTMVLIYLVMALVVPEARTKGQIAEATGKPLTAQEIVENGRARLQELTASARKTSLARRIIIVLLVLVAAIVALGLLNFLWQFGIHFWF